MEAKNKSGAAFFIIGILLLILFTVGWAGLLAAGIDPSELWANPY